MGAAAFLRIRPHETFRRRTYVRNLVTPTAAAPVGATDPPRRYSSPNACRQRFVGLSNRTAFGSNVPGSYPLQAAACLIGVGVRV